MWLNVLEFLRNFNRLLKNSEDLFNVFFLGGYIVGLVVIF